MNNLMIRRVYDIAGITYKGVSVFLNGKKIKVNNFMDYSKLYLSKEDDFVYSEVSERGKIGLSLSRTDKFEQISFVNGIATSKEPPYSSVRLLEIGEKN